jgi:hypothetical protein
MNALNQNLKFYENYFHGIQEIFSYKSTSQEVVFGIFKTVSYLSFILPAIFAVGYLITKLKVEKTIDLCTRVTKLVENRRETIEKIEKYQPAQATQQELVDFLLIKLQDNEKDRLSFVFKKLEPDFQGKFFAVAAEKGVLIEALQLIPKEAKEIIFKIGEDFLFVGNFEKAYTITQTLMNELKNQISDLAELEKITIDLRGVAYYTKKVESIIYDYLIEAYNTHKENYPYKKMEMKGIQDIKWHGGIRSPNNIDAVLCALFGLGNCLCKNSQLTFINIQFEDLNLSAEKIEGNWYVNRLIGNQGVISWKKNPFLSTPYEPRVFDSF